jgi:heptaprenylglyceryl phosphate synthase
MKKRKNKKSKSIKKQKNKKSKKNHIGGNDETKLDKFEQLMINIDKEHNIPTALGISVIKDIP